MANDKTVTGAMGMPPADAPIENAAPLQPELLAVQQARARANEKPLPPFNPPKTGSPVAQTAPAAVQAPKATTTADDVADFFGADVPTVNPEQASVDQVEAQLPPVTDADRERMPAASNSESPARGILPGLVPDKTDKKAITGGWSDGGQEIYNSLHGMEVAELVRSQFTLISKEMENDLRFSMALLYPGIKVKVKVEIDGTVADSAPPFTIEKVRIPKGVEKGSTPLEIAGQLCDHVCFVLVAERQEMTAEGQENAAPPDQIRDDLGLVKPRYTILTGPQGQRMTVDIPSPGADVAALTR